MSEKPSRYQVIDLPAARREMPNLLDIFWWRHFMYGLLEVDATIARQFIAEHKARTGEALSFTGYTVAFDHDVVDGAPAARFVRRLVELIENGYGLAEAQPIPAADAELAAARPEPVLA